MIIAPFTLVQIALSIFVFECTLIFEKAVGVCGTEKRSLSSDRLQCLRHEQPTERTARIITVDARTTFLQGLGGREVQGFCSRRTCRSWTFLYGDLSFQLNLFGATDQNIDQKMFSGVPILV